MTDEVRFTCKKHGDVRGYRNGLSSSGKETIACSECRKDWQKTHRGHRARYAIGYRQKNKATLTNWRKRRNEKARAACLKAYGNRCACCREDEQRFLCIDHIFNDGKQHRQEGATGNRIYWKLAQAGYPKDRYRLLCYNCNNARQQNGGICPHQYDRLTLATNVSE